MMSEQTTLKFLTTTTTFFTFKVTMVMRSPALADRFSGELPQESTYL